MAHILNAFGVLRVPRKVELEGLDFETEEEYRAAVDEIRGRNCLAQNLRRPSCRAF
jgi:hypothetical protein